MMAVPFVLKTSDQSLMVAGPSGKVYFFFQGKETLVTDADADMMASDPRLHRRVKTVMVAPAVQVPPPAPKVEVKAQPVKVVPPVAKPAPVAAPAKVEEAPVEEPTKEDSAILDDVIVSGDLSMPEDEGSSTESGNRTRKKGRR